MDLESAILAALRPSSWRERARLRLAGGLTPVQVFRRLPPPLQESLLAGQSNAELAGRQGLAQVQSVLDSLVSSGKLQRRQAQMQSDDGRGPRGVLVDVYRAIR